MANSNKPDEAPGLDETAQILSRRDRFVRRALAVSAAAGISVASCGGASTCLSIVIEPDGTDVDGAEMRDGDDDSAGGDTVADAADTSDDGQEGDADVASEDAPAD